MQPFYVLRRLNSMKGMNINMGIMLYIKIKTIEKITASMIILNLAVFAILCYNYYIKF